MWVEIVLFMAPLLGCLLGQRPTAAQMNAQRVGGLKMYIITFSNEHSLVFEKIFFRFSKKSTTFRNPKNCLKKEWSDVLQALLHSCFFAHASLSSAGASFTFSFRIDFECSKHNSTTVRNLGKCEFNNCADYSVELYIIWEPTFFHTSGRIQKHINCS